MISFRSSRWETMRLFWEQLCNRPGRLGLAEGAPDSQISLSLCDLVFGGQDVAESTILDIHADLGFA